LGSTLYPQKSPDSIVEMFSETLKSIATETGGKDDLKSLPTEELNNLLNEVLEHEDYIKAIAIRDELKNRNGK
jgi:protein-arginine kinase activator protein McsA